MTTNINIIEEVESIIDSYKSITDLQKSIEKYVSWSKDIPTNVLSNKFLVTVKSAKKDLSNKIDEYKKLSLSYADKPENGAVLASIKRLEMTLSDVEFVESAVKTLLVKNKENLNKKSELKNTINEKEDLNVVKSKIQSTEKIKTDDSNANIVFNEDEFNKESNLVKSLEEELQVFTSFKKKFDVSVDNTFEASLDGNHYLLNDFLKEVNAFMHKMNEMNSAIASINQFTKAYPSMSKIISKEYIQYNSAFNEHIFKWIVFNEEYKDYIESELINYTDILSANDEFNTTEKYVEWILSRVAIFINLVSNKYKDFVKYINDINNDKVSLKNFSEIESAYNYVIENSDIIKSIKSDYLSYFQLFLNDIPDEYNVSEKIKSNYKNIDYVYDLATSGIAALSDNNLDIAEEVYNKLLKLENEYTDYINAIKKANKAIQEAKDAISNMNQWNYRHDNTQDSKDFLLWMWLGYIVNIIEEEYRSRRRYIEAEIERERQEAQRRREEEERQERIREEARRREEESRRSSYSSSSSSDWSSSSSSSSSWSSNYGGGSDSSW